MNLVTIGYPHSHILPLHKRLSCVHSANGVEVCVLDVGKPTMTQSKQRGSPCQATLFSTWQINIYAIHACTYMYMHVLYTQHIHVHTGWAWFWCSNLSNYIEVKRHSICRIITTSKKGQLYIYMHVYCESNIIVRVWGYVPLRPRDALGKMSPLIKTMSLAIL